MTRVVAHLVGGACVAYGGWLLLSTRTLPDLLPVARWLLGGWLVHDLLAVPVALLVGVVLSRCVRGRGRAPVQAGLFVSAALVLAAAPFVLGFGDQTVPYRRNLVFLLTAVWLCALMTAAMLRAARGRRAERGHDRQG